MKISLPKEAKHSVNVAVTSTTTGGDLSNHTVDAGGDDLDLSDFPDDTRIVITRGAETPAADESADKAAPKK